MLDQIAGILEQVRERTPLVQCITNYVTINDCANILLCFGASPAMVEVEDEVEEFAGAISALYINLGTLTEEQHRAALRSARKAAELGKPVVLDPVACGAISRKMEVTRELLSGGGISIIKGNTGEIKSLAGCTGQMRGVDSVDDGAGIVEAGQSLAREYRTVVVATGRIDMVTDGRRTCLIDNGTEMLTMITGAGCMVGALTAAMAGVCEDGFLAGAAAVLAMCLAGEKAAGGMERPMPGTFRVKLFDAIHSLHRDDILKGGRIRCL